MEEYNVRTLRKQVKISIFYLSYSTKNSLLFTLQGHSTHSPIDPSLQDNVLIPNEFFEYIYHIGCAINLHSITNSGLIPGGQNLRKRQTVFFLLLYPMDKEHRDPNKIDSYVNLFLVSLCHSFQVSAPFSTIYSGYAWARSKCVSSWCVECASHHCG